MVALVVSLVALLGVGLLDWVPRWLEADNGVRSVEPGLLFVAPEARGVASLGDGYTVSLYTSGFRYSRFDEVMADTVTRGAPVIAIRGSLDRPRGAGDDTARRDGGAGREDIAHVLPDVAITAVDIRPHLAIYTGTVSGRIDGRLERLPLRWQVALTGGILQTTVTVPGADALVLSLDRRPNVIGIPPRLPEQNLRLRSWWLAPDATGAPAFTWKHASAVGIGPAGAPRAVDLSVDGRIDLHVWKPTAVLRLIHRPPPQPSSDAAPAIRYRHGRTEGHWINGHG